MEFTFKIIYKDHLGSSFLIEYKNENYLVTAKHMFKGVSYNETVFFQMQIDSIFDKIQGRLLYHKNEDVDIAVIKIIPQLAFQNAITINEFQFDLGQEGYFIGFPFGINSTDSSKVNHGFPIPLVKRASFSGVNVTNGAQLLFLDGHNNSGFSGGPVIFKNRIDSNFVKSEFHLAGVVSGYVNENRELSTPQGIIKYVENSGIIRAYSIHNLKEILDSQQK